MSHFCVKEVQLMNRFNTLLISIVVTPLVRQYYSYQINKLDRKRPWNCRKLSDWIWKAAFFDMVNNYSNNLLTTVMYSNFELILIIKEFPIFKEINILYFLLCCVLAIMHIFCNQFKDLFISEDMVGYRI